MYTEDTNERPFMSFMEAQHIMRLKEDCLDAYIAALGELILELRRESQAIFVLVDGLDFFDSEWNDEVLQFIRGLNKVIKKARKQACAGEVGGPVKVLLTTSTQSRCLRWRLSLPLCSKYLRALLVNGIALRSLRKTRRVTPLMAGAKGRQCQSQVNT
jgi:hypothetical protein